MNMSSFTLILSEILTHTSSQFKGWSIGITQDMLDWSAYEDHGRTFQSWDADTLKTAEAIKHLFIDLGMTDCKPTNPLVLGKQTYVYIFKK